LSETYKITIPGEPRGKARPIVTKHGTYTPPGTTIYENLVKKCYQDEYDGMFLGGIPAPLKAEITAYYSLCKSDYGRNGLNKSGNEKLDGVRRPTKKPDSDNIAKIILDSLNKVAYNDDSQIVEIAVKKLYSLTPRVELVLSRAEVDD
jgi:Holliday junction resolvase RusA-like endonuclease